MKENMSCRLCLLMTINDEETFLRKATDIMEKKAKEIAKNLLEIGLTKEQVALTTGLSLEVIKKLS